MTASLNKKIHSDKIGSKKNMLPAYRTSHSPCLPPVKKVALMLSFFNKETFKALMHNFNIYSLGTSKNTEEDHPHRCYKPIIK